MNEHWIPAVGELVTRAHIGEATSRFDICFRDLGDDNWHYVTIALIAEFTAKPYHSSFTECIRARSEQVSNGDVFTRYYTRWDELSAIRRLWNHRSVTFDCWIEEVLELGSLPQNTKDRLKRAYGRGAVDLPQA